MFLYKNSFLGFADDLCRGVLTGIMREGFKTRWGREPGAGEVASWENSLPRVGDLLTAAGLTDGVIALEYEVPYNETRVDCLLFGAADGGAGENVVLIELKQWSDVRALADEGNFVETFTGGLERVVAHPSQQVKGYHQYLAGFVAEFVAPDDDGPPQPTPKPLGLFGCAYCHNYEREPGAGLFAPVYGRLLGEFPTYGRGDADALAGRLRGLLGGGRGEAVFARFAGSALRPSRKLLENAARVIRREPVFALVGAQLVARNDILSKVRKNHRERPGGKKSVVIVQGGPGTGKSLVAVNVLAQTARRGELSVFYGCKSKPFISGLGARVGAEGRALFSNLYRFVPSKVAENGIDLLLIDEAHRIERSSNHQYTRPADRTEMPQVEQLIRCARTSVFFIDDRQNVRSQEMGHSGLIRECAARLGCEVSEVTLRTQFRCMGSNEYLAWLESTLGYGGDGDDDGEPVILRAGGAFDFRIMDSPQAVHDALAGHEARRANSARLVAGFCWPWSKALNADGELEKDVRIGEFAMPWETHSQIARPPRGYVEWFEWAYRPEGFKQVGCIYTAQGFEFDYVGVIIGDDLTVDAQTGRLAGNLAATRDPMLRKHRENFEMHMKNIYRTLLTRGMRGCYVYFTDKGTERFFRERMEDGNGRAG